MATETQNIISPPGVAEVLGQTAPSRPQPPAKLQPATGVQVNSDGSVRFQMTAPAGADVRVKIGAPIHKQDAGHIMSMEDINGNGFFVADLKDHGLIGPQNISFIVNGVEKINPAAPMWYHANRLCNYVELPDPETDELIAARKDIPHGAMTFESFYSETFGEFISSVVYTPPGYEKGGEYPVLYFFHEVAENKTAWTGASRMNYLFDNLIADGKCVPFILVENDCTVDLNYHDKEDWWDGYDKLERFMTHDCPEYIASKYRVKPGKENRAISGIGLGAVQAAYIGLRNTNFFASLGLFTAFWPSVSFHKEGKEDPFYTAIEYVGAHPEVMDVFYHSEGDLDGHFPLVKYENDLLAELGIEAHPGYVYKVYHQDHNWGSYRRSFRDFLPLLFRK